MPSLAGSKLLNETINVTRPDGRVVSLEHDSGVINRIDRLTAANYGMAISIDHC